MKRVLATKISDLSTFQSEREALLGRIAERDAKLQKLEDGSGAEVPRLRDRITELETALSSSELEAARMGQLEAEAAALRAQTRRLDAALVERGERFNELERELAEARNKLTEREAQVRRLEAEAAEAAESLAWGSAPTAGDDLTRIKGIGPKYRDALARAGVVTFAQIAAWTEADVVEFAQKVKVQPARIVRDGWVDAARTLAGQGQRDG